MFGPVGGANLAWSVTGVNFVRPVVGQIQMDWKTVLNLVSVWLT